MAAVAAQPNLVGLEATPSFPVETEFEVFPIPDARLVHGSAFPLGIRPKKDAAFADIESVVRSIEQLAKKKVFDGFLQNSE